MLAGQQPALFSSAASFLLPANANGNDSNTISLLHFDAVDALVNGSTAVPIVDSAYGVPSRKNAWTTNVGTFKVSSGTAQGIFNTTAYFDGGCIIQCPHAADLIPVGDFTIDFWIAIATTTQICSPIAKGNSGTHVPYQFVINNANLYFYASSNGSAWDIINGQAMLAGFAGSVWYHLAVTRQGSTWCFYLNGNLITTTTSALPMMQNTLPLTLGGAIGGNGFGGWIEEFRFSNICRYTGSTFPVPNQPYYSRLDTGGNDEATKLLLHFDNNSFADSAKGAINPRTPTNYGLTFAGTPTTTTLGGAVVNASASAQRVTYPQSFELDFGAANFTIDFWYYRNSTVSGHIIGKRATNGEIAPWLFLDMGNGNINFLLSNAGSAWDLNAAIIGGLAIGAWNHIAVVRNGSDLSAYGNGVRTFQQNIGMAGQWRNANVVSVGGNSGVSPACYIEEVRISRCARWLGPFTPPTIGGPAYL